MRRIAGVFLLGFAVAACHGASSDASGAPASSTCDASPWSCAAGTTCWPSNDTTETAAAFACLPSAAAKVGDACSPTIGAATCGDAQGCYQSDDGTGVCAAFCDSSHACAGGATCTPVAYVAGDPPVYSLCVSTTGAAGSGGAAGSPTIGQGGFAGDADGGYGGGLGPYGVDGNQGDDAGAGGSAGDTGSGGQAGAGGDAGASGSSGSNSAGSSGSGGA